MKLPLTRNVSYISVGLFVSIEAAAMIELESQLIDGSAEKMLRGA
jgi:hypothetical protein